MDTPSPQGDHLALDPADKKRARGNIAVAALKALRPKQWTKNGLVFAAIIFSMHFTEVELLVRVAVAFVSFSLVSSSGYLLNDARDVEADRRHPTKRRRPIASGALPVKAAYVEMVLVFVVGCALAWWLTPMFLLVVLLYFATTISYSLYFKNIVILDVMFISAGFLWRAVAGAVAIDVVISPWLLVCTGFLALFFGFNKRRGELVLMAEQASGTRKNLKEYSSELVVEFQAITTSGTIISYAIYCVLASPTPWLVLTLPYVLYAIFRYMYLVGMKEEGGAPDETLLRDRPILLTAAAYGVTVLLILVLAPLRHA